jgi:hypothetical protein
MHRTDLNEASEVCAYICACLKVDFLTGDCGEDRLFLHFKQNIERGKRYVWIVYIAHGIMKMVIEFYKNVNGQKPVLDFLIQLRENGKTDRDAKELYKLTLRGLNYLEQMGVNHVLRSISVLEREDGTPYSIQLVKTLHGFAPLLEFRINWRPSIVGKAGAVRILFVVLDDQNYSYVVLIRALIKSQTTDPAFQLQRNEAYALLPDLFRSPEKYISISHKEG